MSNHPHHPHIPPTPHGRADGFVQCSCGERHWGLRGAAGLLLWRDTRDEVELLLQLRAEWSHQGGTWATPGGAIDVAETPLQGALREFSEETGAMSDRIVIDGEWRLAHPDWSYTTFVGHPTEALDFTLNPESSALRWIRASTITELRLLPAFASALPELSRFIPRLS